MASGHITKIVVFDERLYHSNGDVFKWCVKITNTFERHAQHFAPARSGELRAGITADTDRIGVRQVEGIIASTAPHTKAVLFGTDGPIRSTLAQTNPGGAVIDGRKQRGYWLKVRAGAPRPPSNSHYRGQSFPKHVAFQVSGQRANNFLFRAWRATGRNHSAIRGVLPPDEFGG